jgi:hypothetical protein
MYHKEETHSCIPREWSLVLRNVCTSPGFLSAPFQIYTNVETHSCTSRDINWLLVLRTVCTSPGFLSASVQIYNNVETHSCTSRNIDWLLVLRNVSSFHSDLLPPSAIRTPACWNHPLSRIIQSVLLSCHFKIECVATLRLVQLTRYGFGLRSATVKID